MDEEFRKVFQASINKQMEQNEAARDELENFLGGLRSQTTRMMTQGNPFPATFYTTPPPVEEPQQNLVTQDWVKTVIQAATLDLNFHQEVGTRASQIVLAASQQPPATPATPADVPPPQPSG